MTFETFIHRVLADFETDALRRRHEEAARRGVPVEVIDAEEAAKRAEDERQQAEAHARYAQQQKARYDEQARRRKACGEKLGLGVPAHVGHIIKLGGLGERSSCTGTTRNTVLHVVLDAELHRGRLHRKQGDLLCRPARTLGRRTSLDVSGTGGFGDYLDDWWFDKEITCAACLNFLARLNEDS